MSRNNTLKCYNCGKVIQRGDTIFMIPWPKKEKVEAHHMGQMEEIICAECEKMARNKK